MEISRRHILRLEISHESDIGICRRKAVANASAMGFDEVKTGEIAIMVTELVSNVVKHAGGKGALFLAELTFDSGSRAMECWCCDFGNGIDNPDVAIRDGFTGKGSLGIGLGSIRRLSDEMELNPEILPALREKITGDTVFSHCIRTVKFLPARPWIGTNPALEAGVASRSKPGEVRNGDSYLVHHFNPGRTIAAVIDGLGHGQEAFHAAQLAHDQILMKPDIPLNALMQHIHKSLQSTRGATIGIVHINTTTGILEFSGIGNIEGFILSPKGRSNFLSYGGIMGHNMRTPRVFSYEFCAGDSVCLLSDGITSRWKYEDIPWQDAPQQTADHILLHFSRPNDDATVLILRHLA